MHGSAQRMLQRCAPGVLFADLSACNSYQDAVASAAKITMPTTLILGEKDMMTPLKAGRALAAAIPHARTVVIKGAGHTMMVEKPDELLAALKS
jgi:pimeloyl-ACP methyl ester carboxylesterase